MAKPFTKFVGGKRRLVPQILPHFPTAFKNYYEPFVGGGALFFALEPKSGVISDSNERLIRTYHAVQKDVGVVVSRLTFMAEQHRARGRAFYDEVRKFEIDAEDDSTVAAWLLYLTKTSYNGLFRVNRSGVFNAPFGDYKNPKICDETALRDASRVLQGTRIEHGDFESIVGCAGPGDLIYCDPPYVPLSVTASFTGYTGEGFGMPEQVRLRDLVLRLKRQGATVLVSNSSAPAVRDLYSPDLGFQIVEVQASRAINCKGDGRGNVVEYLIK